MTRSPSRVVTSAMRMSPICGVAFRLGHDLAVGRQQPAFLALDVLVGEGVDERVELQALVVGQVELRPDLDLELVDQRPFLRQLDAGRVDVRAS